MISSHRFTRAARGRAFGLAVLLALLAGRVPVRAAPGLPRLTLPEGVGVNIHFTRGHEQDLDLIAAAGIRWVRMDFGWGGTERRPGDYNWTDYDELTANLERRQIRPIYILDYSNALYERTSVTTDPVTGKEQRAVESPQHPESVAAFARWASAAAKHFRGRGVVWEIWNEPNIKFWKPAPDVTQYIALAAATARAVREADPDALLVGPASSEFPWTFLEAFLASGALQYLDAVSVHPYRNYNRGPETAVADYQRLRDLISRHMPPGRTPVPILSGEWGYATHVKGASLETQAAFVARQQLSNLLYGIPISIWYDWKNDGRDPAEAEHNFGLVTDSLEPKPAYGALKTLTAELTGFRIARRFDAGAEEDFEVLFVNASGAQKLVVWTTGKPHEVRLHTGLAPGDVAAVDGQGQSRALRTEGDNLVLELEAAPQYLTFAKPMRGMRRRGVDFPQRDAGFPRR